LERIENKKIKFGTIGMNFSEKGYKETKKKNRKINGEKTKNHPNHPKPRGDIKWVEQN